MNKVGEGSPHVVDAIRGQDDRAGRQHDARGQGGARQLLAPAPDAAREHPVLHDDVGGAGRGAGARGRPRGQRHPRCAASRSGTAESLGRSRGATESPPASAFFVEDIVGAPQGLGRGLAIGLVTKWSGGLRYAIIRGRDAKVSARPALARSRRKSRPTKSAHSPTLRKARIGAAPRSRAASAPGRARGAMTSRPRAPSARSSNVGELTVHDLARGLLAGGRRAEASRQARAVDEARADQRART